jgi:hypothetical protein
VHRDQRHHGRRDAACQKQGGDAIVHVPVALVRHGAARLGDGGKPEVGADGHCRVQPECADEQRRHQRAAAHAGQPDDRADAEAAQNRQSIHALSCLQRGPRVREPGAL